MKKILQAVIMAAVLWLIGQSTSALTEVDSTVLSRTYPSGTDVHSVMHYEGSAVVVYPNANQTGVIVHALLPELDSYDREVLDGGEWLEPVELINDSVEGSVRQVIRDLQLVSYEGRLSDGGRQSYVAWIAEYYDAEDSFLTERLQMYVISGHGYDEDTFEPHYDNLHQTNGQVLNDLLTVEQVNDIEYAIASAGVSVRILLSNADQQLIGWYSGQDEWSEAYVLPITNVDHDLTMISGRPVFSGFNPETNKTHFYATYRSFLTGGGGSGNGYPLYEINKFTGQYLSSTSYYNRETETSYYYAVINNGNKLDLVTLSYNYERQRRWQSSVETVFTDLSDIRKANIVFNPYGEGQIALAVKSVSDGKKHMSLALRRADGWVKAKKHFSRKRKVYLPEIQAFSNGQINMLWRHKRKLYRSTYAAGDSAWSEATRMRRHRKNRNWILPYGSTQYTQDGEQTVEWFRSRSNGNLVLRTWNIAHRLSGATALMPSNTRPLSVIQKNGMYHILLLQGDDRLLTIKSEEH